MTQANDRRQKIHAAEAAGLRFPFGEPPEPGTMREIADRIFWAQMPMPMLLDHINIYILRDSDGWTIIDTGLATHPALEAWKLLLAGPLAGAEVRRVIASHWHPDHFGAATPLCQQTGATFWTTQTAFLMAHTLRAHIEPPMPPTVADFYHMAGLKGEWMELIGHHYSGGFRYTAPPPSLYHRLQEGQVIKMAGREWHVLRGDGHAAEHALFYDPGEDILIAQDQLLPRITSVISLNAFEPFGDPMAEWLACCRRFGDMFTDQTLVLCGHNEPFRGAVVRWRQLVEHHERTLAALHDFVREPRTAFDCFELMFPRRIVGEILNFASMEALAHLNHLEAEGRARRSYDADGAALFEAV